MFTKHTVNFKLSRKSNT